MALSAKSSNYLQVALGNVGAANEIQNQLYGQSADGNAAMQVMRVTYNFAQLGGAIGTIVLPGAQLPANAVVMRAVANVTSAVLGGVSATWELLLGSDVLNAQSSSLPGVGPVLLNSGNPLAPNSSAPLSVSLVVGTAALTAGEMVIYLEYSL